MNMTTDPVRQRMVAADPADVELPDGVMNADVLLALIDERSGEMERMTSPKIGADRRWRNVRIAVGFAALLILAIGLPVVLFGGDEPIATEQPTTSPTPITTTSVPPTTATTTTSAPVVPPPVLQWERVSDSVLDEGTSAHAVIRRNGELLAVGISDEDGALWRSSDGRTWERISDPAFADTELKDVVPYGDGLVVIGNTPSDWESPKEPVIAVSEDGESWERIDTSDLGVFVPRSMDWRGPLQSAAVTGDRIVVVGTHIWISEDARTWTLAQELEEWHLARGVTVGDHGIVAVGENLTGSLPSALILHSTDGDQWTEIPMSTPDRPATIAYAVEATSQGYVAGGQVDDIDGAGPQTGDAAVWVSPDGLTWTNALDDRKQLGGEHGQYINGFAEDGDVLVAVGIEIHSNWATATAAVWESHDGGLTWQRVADPDHRFGNVTEAWAEMADVVVHDGRLIAVGGTGENVDQPGAIGVWLGTRSE